MDREGTLIESRKTLGQQDLLFTTDNNRVSITWFILRLGLSLWQRMKT
jgi:hypothetical protein